MLKWCLLRLWSSSDDRTSLVSVENVANKLEVIWKGVWGSVNLCKIMLLGAIVLKEYAVSGINRIKTTTNKNNDQVIRV